MQPTPMLPPPRRRLITVEPLLFAYFFTFGVHGTASLQLMFEGYCFRRLNASTCRDGPVAAGALKDVVDSLQASTSRLGFYCSLVYVLPVVLVCAYLGTWSDAGSRKRPLLVPLLGAAASYALWAAQSRFGELVDPTYALLSSAPLGLSGCYSAALQTCFGYLAVIAPPEQRTMRMAAAEASLAASVLVSSFAVGPLLQKLGTTLTYVALSATNASAALYCVLWIDEAPRRTIAAFGTVAAAGGWTSSGASRGGRCALCCVRSAVAPIVDYAHCAFKRRSGHVTLHLRGCLVSYLLAYCSGTGASDVLYLYLTKVRGFSTSLYGYYVGVDYGFKLSVGLLALALMRRCLGADELAVAMCGCLSIALSQAVLCAAIAPWMIWLSSGVNCLQLLYSVGIRSHVASLVPEDELGKIFAFISSGQSLLAFATSLLFNNLYPVSLDFYPGLCFSLASLLSVVAVATLASVKNHARGHAISPCGRTAGDAAPPLARDRAEEKGDDENEHINGDSGCGDRLLQPESVDCRAVSSADSARQI